MQPGKIFSKENDMKILSSLPFMERLRTWWQTVCSAAQRADHFLSAHSTAVMWLCGILYRIALDANYVWAVSPVYSYEGMIYSPNGLKYVISWVLYLIAFAYIPKIEYSAPIFILHLQLAWIMAPIFSFYGLADESTRYILMVFFCVMLETYIVRKPRKTTVSPRIVGVKNYVSVALLILLVPTLLVSILYNGFAGLKAFDLSYYMTIRRNTTLPTWFEYLFAWMTFTISPFFMVYFLEKKKYWLSVGCILLEVILYMESGKKAVFLFPIVLLAVYTASKLRHLVKLTYGGLSLLLLTIIPLARMDVPHGHSFGFLLNAFVGERALVSGGPNKFLYYHLFSELPKIHFSDGLIGKAFGLTYPYTVGSGQMVYAYGGGEFMYSNSITGYIGESYAQLGFPGMLIFSVLLAYIIRFLFSLDSRKSFSILVSSFAIYIVLLTDAPFLTTFFSGGMFVTVFLCFIYLNSTPEEDSHGIHRF